MANNYLWRVNPFQDFLFQLLLSNLDISDKIYKNDINAGFINILNYFYPENENDLIYLDFEINKRDEFYNVVGKNLISSLWLSGIIPDNPVSVNISNEYILNDIKYTFNKKKKCLILNDIK